MPLYIFNLNPHTQSVKSKYNCDAVRRFADDGRTRAAFSGKDVARLIAYDYHSTLMSAAIILAATTGMRCGEIRALRWQDVGLDHIDVRNSI